MSVWVISPHTWPGVSLAAPASVYSSQAVGAPEHGSPSPWPLGCPALDGDRYEDRGKDCEGNKDFSMKFTVSELMTSLMTHTCIAKVYTAGIHTARTLLFFLLQR